MAINWLTGSLDVEQPVAVAYTERESYSKGGYKASVTLDCRWEDRYAIAADILFSGLVWPYNPDALLWIESVDVEPAPTVQQGQDGYGNTYLRARLNLSFSRNPGESNPDEDDPQVRFQESIDVNGEMLKMPHTMFLWEDQDNVPTIPIKEEESPSMILVGADYVVTWDGLTSVPSAFFDAVSKVNEYEVSSASLGATFASETLLFNPPKISRTVTVDPEVNRFHLECRWSHRAAGWNKFWRPTSQTFEPMWVENPFYPLTTPQYEEYKPFQLFDMSEMLP